LNHETQLDRLARAVPSPLHGPAVLSLGVNYARATIPCCQTHPRDGIALQSLAIIPAFAWESNSWCIEQHKLDNSSPLNIIILL
jgi:hypothetical protein